MRGDFAYAIDTDIPQALCQKEPQLRSSGACCAHERSVEKT